MVAAKQLLILWKYDQCSHSNVLYVFLYVYCMWRQTLKVQAQLRIQYVIVCGGVD
jgi:hypothetical protein